MVTREAGQIVSARGVVLPGVGAFSACMENLGRFGLIQPICDIVRHKKPFLGYLSWDSNCCFQKAKNSADRRGSIFLPAKSSAFILTTASRCRTWAGTVSRRKRSRPF